MVGKVKKKYHEVLLKIITEQNSAQVTKSKNYLILIRLGGRVGQNNKKNAGYSEGIFPFHKDFMVLSG